MALKLKPIMAKEFAEKTVSMKNMPDREKKKPTSPKA